MARIYKKPGPSKNKAKANHERKTEKPASNAHTGENTNAGGNTPGNGEKAQDGQGNG